MRTCAGNELTLGYKNEIINCCTYERGKIIELNSLIIILLLFISSVIYQYFSYRYTI